jgi:hypothetical protein
VHRSGQDYGDKSMVYPPSPAGLVLRSRVKTPSLSQSSSMAARRLSASLALKTSNKFRSIIFSTGCSISFSSVLIRMLAKPHLGQRDRSFLSLACHSTAVSEKKPRLR